MKPPPASGAASAHRVHRRTTSTAILETRNTPCRIALRAEMEKLRNSMKNQTHFGTIWTSLNSSLCQILQFGPELLRFSENRKPKTENSQRRCDLRFPYCTGRCNTTGLLEQMPRSHGSMSFGSNGPHRHKPTPLIPDRHSAKSKPGSPVSLLAPGCNSLFVDCLIQLKLRQS